MANDSKELNKAKERTAGVGGALAFGLAVVTFALDWISRGQTLLALYPYIHSPILQIGELVLAFSGVLYATRRERVREKDEAPRIITLETREAPEPKRHYFYLKLAGASIISGMLIGISLLIWFRHMGVHLQNTSHPMSAPGTVGQNGAPQAPAASRKTQLPATAAASDGPTMSGQPKPSVTLPVQAPPSATASGNQNHSSEPPALAQPSNSKPETPTACPPKGTLSLGWILVAGNTQTPTGFKYQLDRNGISPLLNVHDDFIVLQSQMQLNDADMVFSELRSRVPDPKPVQTATKSIPTHTTNGSLQHTFGDGANILISYVDKTSTGVYTGSHTVNVAIGKLSEAGRHAIADLDQYSKSLADTDCANSLLRLEGSNRK